MKKTKSDCRTNEKDGVKKKYFEKGENDVSGFYPCFQKKEREKREERGEARKWRCQQPSPALESHNIVTLE